MKLALILLAFAIQAGLIVEMSRNALRLCRARRAHDADRRARRDEL